MIYLFIFISGINKIIIFLFLLEMIFFHYRLSGKR